MTISNERRPVEAADLFRLRFLQGAQLSPDGASVVYAVSHVDPDSEVEYVTLWLLSLAEGGAARPLTAGTARDSNPQWSPDGRQIVFRSNRSGLPQLYVIAIDGGEAQPLTAMEQGVGGGAVWSPDGQQIAFTARPDRQPRDPSKPYRLTRHVFRFDRIGYLDEAAHDLYVIAAAGGEPRRLTDDGCHNTQPQWSPRGDELLYLASFCPGSHRYPPRLRVVNLSGQSREPVGEWGSALSAAWLPDGEHIAFVGAPRERSFAAKYDLWVVTRQANQPACRTAGLRLGVAGLMQVDMPVALPGSNPPVLVTRDGRHAYSVVLYRGSYHVYRIALDGAERCEPVVAGQRCCVLYDLDDRSVLFGVSDFNDPLELCVAATDGSDERRLTGINSGLLSQRALPAVEHLQFSGKDGSEVEGWLMRPPAGRPPYPTILNIHGGRYAAWGRGFVFDSQLLAGAGYAVLLVNYRGSRGYGDEFSTAAVRDWGNHDYGDLMAGVDFAVGQGLADPDRLGCCGVSAGGTLTCWIVGHTDRFKAAVPENPVTNWVSEHGTSDIGPWFHEYEFGGPLHETMELALANSAIRAAHRCKTPTLIVFHEADFRCPATQAEEFYSVLQASGCPVEMVRFPGSSHGGAVIGDPIVRRVQNQVLLDWMNRYVLGLPPDPQIAC